MKFNNYRRSAALTLSVASFLMFSYLAKSAAASNIVGTADGAACAQLFSSSRGKLFGDFKIKPRVVSSEALSHGEEVAAKKRAQDAERDAIRSLPAKDVRRLALGAATKFQNYFSVLNSILHERQELFELIRISLIAEEHLLLMGSPGNAKSLAADLALGNIKDDRGETSYFRIQMTPETTMSETHGPMDYKKLEKTGEYDRLHKQGMGAYRNVFVDEIADARPNATRNILGFLAERTYPQGSHVVDGAIETVIAATNRYLSEWYKNAGDDGPRGVIDRFALIVFMQANFEYTDSYVKLIRGAAKNKLPDLKFSHVEALRALNDQVEISEPVAKILSLISTRMKAETEGLEAASLKDYDEKVRNGEKPNPPYRATKLHSARTLGKAAKILRAFVVDDWIKKHGKRKLEATIQDLAQLQKFFALNGPNEDFANVEMASTSNEHERVQLRAVIQEREIFVRIYNEIVAELEVATDQYHLAEFGALKASAKNETEKHEAAQKIMTALAEVVQEKKPNLRQAELSGAEIAKDYAQNYLEGLLKGLVSYSEFDQLRTSVYTEIARIKKEAMERPERERKAAEERAVAIRREEARRAALETAEARAAEARSKRLSAAFTDPAKYSKTVLATSHSDEQPHADFVTAYDEASKTFAFYFNDADEILAIDSSGATISAVQQGLAVKYDKAIVDEVGRTRVSQMYFSSPRTLTLLPRNGMASVEFNLDSVPHAVAKPLSAKQGFLVYDSKNRRYVFFDPLSLRLTVIKDGVQELKNLTYVPNGHWTDEQVRSISPQKDADFKLSADGSYGVLISKEAERLFHVDFAKSEIRPIRVERKGYRSSGHLRFVLREGEDRDAPAVDGHTNHVVQVLDVSSSTPAVRDLKAVVDNTHSLDFDVVEHIAGTSLFLVADNTNSSRIVLFDGESGQPLANDIFGLEADADEIASIRAFEGGFVIQRRSGSTVIVNMKQ